MSKTITDIIPPSRRRRMEEEGVIAPTPRPASSPIPPPPPLDDRPVYGSLQPKKRGFPYFALGFAVFAVAVSIGLMTVFAQARVTVTPRTASAPVSQEFTATLGTGQLPFELVTVEKTVSVTVPAESSETVNDPATGTIVIRNAQENPQTLIKNTRFESPEGQIFRIQESVTIPGGSPSSPGTVRAAVFADVGGEAYNIAPTTFTVPGLSGTSAFELVTGTSDAPMTGGFAGTRPSVGQATRDREQANARQALTEALDKAVQEELPAGYVVLPGSSFYTYTPARDSEGERENTVNVNLRGTAVSVAFPELALAGTLAGTLQGDYAGEPVLLGSTESLTLTPTTPGAPAAGQEEFRFSLAGTASLVWDISPERIAGAVAGKSRDAADAILSGLPEVAEARMRLSPLWRRTFPTEPEQIVVATTSASEVGE